jgi:hypothetical protein
MAVQKTQVVVQKTTFAQAAVLAARNLKNSDGQPGPKIAR